MIKPSSLGVDLVAPNSSLENTFEGFIKRLELPVSYLRNYQPEWLRRPQTGRKLHLDFYFPPIEVAIEVQGEQHDRPGWGHGLSGLLIIQGRDKFKREACQRRGVVLLEYRTPADLALIEATINAKVNGTKHAW
jgi:hypothetical protein